MSSPPPEVRPDRHALLELDALLDAIIRRRDAGDWERYDSDDDYRWVIHRLWIAAGNEALAYMTYVESVGSVLPRPRLWRRLYTQRNKLAHQRLPDIEDGFS